jgi:UPF0755 protein
MTSRLIRNVAILLSAAVAGAGFFAWRAYRQPLPLPTTPYTFEVRSGSSLATVARELAAAGVLEHAWLLIGLARLRRADRAIKAGSYELEPPIRLPQLLAKLTQGDVTQKAVTIGEGTTLADLRRVLRMNPDLRATLVDVPDEALLAKLGLAGTTPEGRFFPDTYFFAAGTTDAAVLRRAARALDERLEDAWRRRAPDLPLATPNEALILASIVEKETGRAADRPLIASVFVNRLRKGMRLQTDPTVIYGMGDRFDGNLRKRDLEADTPWNTYTRDGLPPTPIAFVSQAALDAVVNPPATEFLYFVARGDGTSQFSNHLAEHNRAVSKFQKGGR